MGSASGPLEGIDVLDLTEGDGAPFCAMLLGDAGANVLKVESITGDWARRLGPPFDEYGDSAFFIAMNRNKRSLAVDLDSVAGCEIVRLIASKVDVVIESFTSLAYAETRGLDYQSVSQRNRALIYCDVSAHGRSGPSGSSFGTDLTLQAKAGLFRFVGRRGGVPVRFGTNYLGIVASMYAMQGVLAALYWRETSGAGQLVDTSYLRAAIATQQNFLTASSEPDAGTDRQGSFYNRHLDAPNHGYATADGYVEIRFNGRDPEVWRRLGAALDVQRFMNLNPDELGHIEVEMTAELRTAIARLSTREVAGLLDQLGIQCAPIHSYETMCADPGVLEQDVIIAAAGGARRPVAMPGFLWKMLATPAAVTRGAPLLGEHTREVLQELGYEDAAISELSRQGVIR